MNNLTTRKIVLGMLMVLVLAFSVQGIADALSLSATSDTVQSKRGVTGVDFEVEFSVGLTRSQIKAGYGTRRSSDPHYNKNMPYYDTANSLDDWNKANPGTGLGNGLRYKKVGSTFYYFTVEDLTSGTNTATDSNSDGDYSDVGDIRYGYEYYDSQGSSQGGATFDANFPQHIYERGSPVTAVHNGATTGDEKNIFTESEAYYFNDEAIAITLGGEPLTSHDLRLTGGAIVNVPDATARATGEMATTAQASLFERAAHQDLRLSNNTIRLTFAPETPTVGEFQIIVTDVTPMADFPNSQSPREQDSITFTLYSTTEDPPLTGGDAVTISTQANTQYQRVDTAEDIETASSRFNVDPDQGVEALNARVRYTVVKGSGTLYVGTIKEEFTTPATDLTVHRDANVFLNMNGTTNEVSASIAGSDRRTFGATIVFEYSGSTKPTTSTTTTTTTTTPTNTITISPSSTTGDPGETETISVSSSPTGVLVTLSSTEFANTNFSPQSGITPFTSTLTLPSSTRSYSFFAFGSIGGATVSDSASVTVATTAPGTLTITAIGTPANGAQTVRVTVRDSDGTLHSGALNVTLTGPGVSRTVDTLNGTGDGSHFGTGHDRILHTDCQCHRV